MSGDRGQLPKAYLRIDPNLDSTHPAPGDMVALLCAANRQPRRGWFKSAELAQRVLGRALYRRSIERGDLKPNGSGIFVDGWQEWQEGDVNVGERMRRLRAKRVEDHGTPDRTDGAYRTAQWRLRTAVFERDEYTCRYCGDSDGDREWLVAEHVIPQPDGETTMDNLVTACRSCNKRKGPRTPEEAGMVLLPEPGAQS